jgi:hypothetical protein
MRDSRQDEDSEMELGLAKFLLSGSHYLTLVKVFPLSEFISHAYPLSFVLVKLQYCISTITILVFHQISMDFQFKKIIKLALDPSKHS